MYNSQNPDDSLIFRMSQLGEGYRLSRNFRLGEPGIQSGCGSDIIFIHPALILLMQELRDEYGALRVNSLYRSQAHNTRIQGSKESKHLLGMAVDLSPLETKFERFRDGVSQMDNVGGIGIYRTFIHVDVYGQNRRWNG
jgi:uncharacterized protein YcbK (DUF882 family)